MIRLLLEPVNFLILDEPTNHLDMRTKDVLKEAIRAFDGTVIVVSHDREFLDGLVSKVYEFGGGRVREHIGGIYDFLRKKEIDSLDELKAVPSRKEKAPAQPSRQVTDKQEGGASSYEQRKEQARLLRKAEKKVAECEARVMQLEEEKSALEEQMSAPADMQDSSLFGRYGTIQKQLAEAESAWETSLEELEALQRNG